MMVDTLDFNDAPTQGREEGALETALGYAARGWPVFPCNPLSKAPLTASGFKDATIEASQIRFWWKQWPRAMIGIPTGAASGFWALDIDNGEGKTGLASLGDMGHDLSDLLDTAVANTASGGYHCLFRWSPDQPIGNSRGALKRFLDVRGEGGYIIAAGSTRADGRQYAWLNPPDEMEIGEAPDWLVSAIAGAAPGDAMDFNGAARAPVAPAERVASIAPGTWHENTRDLVARMVREGASDETIAAIAPRFTEAGYTDAQTVREFLIHARTARAKWGYQPKEAVPLADPDAQQALRFKILSIAELINVRPPEWRIDGIFPTHGSSVIYGAFETFKTFIALDMTLSLATGRDWQGRTTKPCSVLYVAGEGQVGLGIRAAGWLAAHDAQEARFQALPEAVAIPSQGDQDELLRAIDAMADHPEVIVLDTVTRMTGGGSLNDEKDAQAYVRGMDRLRIATGAHILNIGHAGKDKEKGILGSTVLPAAMETIIFVDRRDHSLTLINGNPRGKQKDGPNFEDIRLRTQIVDFEHHDQALKTIILTSDDTEERTENEAHTQRAGGQNRRPGVNQLAISKALKKAEGQALGLTRLSQMIGKSTSDTLKAVAPMVEKGLVLQSGEEGAWRWELAPTKGEN